jgi:hypothetical protein
MIIYTAVATAGVCVLHRYWPLFRRQTFAGKAFVVSSFTMAGCVIGAEHAEEDDQREEEESQYVPNANDLGFEREGKERRERRERMLISLSGWGLLVS